MRAFLAGPLHLGEPVTLRARAESDGGHVGDAAFTVRPGDSVAGVPYADLVAALQARGWIDLGDGPGGAA